LVCLPGLGTNLIEALAKQLDAGVERHIDATGTIVSLTYAPIPSRLPAPETIS
jgi:two-component sensor histidine kinase